MNGSQQFFGAIVLAALCAATLCTVALGNHYAKVIQMYEDNHGPVPRGVENQAERSAMMRTHQAINKKLSIFMSNNTDPDWLDMAANKINDLLDDVTN